MADRIQSQNTCVLRFAPYQQLKMKALIVFSIYCKNIVTSCIAHIFDTAGDNHFKRRLQIAAFTYFAALSFQISNVIVSASGNISAYVLPVSLFSILILLTGVIFLIQRKHWIAIYIIVVYMIIRQNIVIHMHLQGLVELNTALIYIVLFALVHILDLKKSIVAATIYSVSVFAQIYLGMDNSAENWDAARYVQFLFIYIVAMCWAFFSEWNTTKAYWEREQAQEREKRSAELYAQNVEILLKNKKQLLADVSHELRTPLSVLRANIEAMEDGINQQSESYPVIHRKLHQIDRLIHDIYFISKYDNQQLALYTDTVSVADLTDELVASFNRFARDKGLTLTAELPFKDNRSGDMYLEADWQRLVQLFGNLLQNSIDYTDHDGQIKLSALALETGIEITVQDSAPGVPTHEQSKLFERLYRRESSRNRATGGSGLGLTICKAIVEAHHGTIEITSSPLGGLAVITWLPLVQPRI